MLPMLALVLSLLRGRPATADLVLGLSSADPIPEIPAFQQNLFITILFFYSTLLQ